MDTTTAPEGIPSLSLALVVATGKVLERILSKDARGLGLRQTGMIPQSFPAPMTGNPPALPGSGYSKNCIH